MCRAVPKFQNICWKLGEHTKTLGRKIVFKAFHNRNSWKTDENTKTGLSDLKFGEAERYRDSSPRPSAIII